MKIGHPLIYKNIVDSTNIVLRKLAGSGAEEGTVVWAEQQMAGRGRHGRGWESPPGKGLWFSVLLRPELSLPQIPLLTLVSAVSLVRGISRMTGFAPTIKWPNDLLANGKKLAGILAEVQSEGREIKHVVVGIGINVNHTLSDFPPQLADWATSLRLVLGRPWNRRALLESVLEQLDKDYQEVRQDGFDRLLQLWRAHCCMLGQVVRVTDLVEGTLPWQGTALDIDQNGALILMTDAGRRIVRAGDVSLSAGKEDE